MAPKYTDENLNYFRLCFVVTCVLPEGLRTVFKQQWDARYQATHGQWLDVPANATAFYNMESPRNQRRNARLLAIMANGKTNEWDCTCLFYAILFSDCLGPFLNSTVQKSVDELREIRNKVFAHTADGRLTDVDFDDAMRKILAAFKALGLNTVEVEATKNQKTFPTDELSRIHQQLNDEKKSYAKFKSFCVLPPKPSHDTTDRADEVNTINHEMEKLRSTKKNETTFIYLSGNPGCGKSEIARQIGNEYFDKFPEDKLKFVFTFNASSIDTLLQSYVDFAVRLSCDEDVVTRIATSKDLSPEEKINQMKSLINPKVQIYSSWLIIVDNVNNLKSVSKYLPQAGEKTSGDGQILVTTQDSQAIPLDSYTYHYPSLKEGMKEDDAVVLLAQISGATGDRDTLLNIASALDFQPLALACAAVYMQQVFHYTDDSGAKWEDYLLKLQEGKREATEEAYMNRSISSYQSGMTAAVKLALERVVKEDKIMMHAFQFLLVIANEPIPLKYVVQHVMNCLPDKDQYLVAAHISSSSLVISYEDVEISKAVRVHQVVYHGLQKLFQNETDILVLMSVFSDLVCSKNTYNTYSVTKAEIIVTRPLVPHFVVISRKLSPHLLGHSDLTDGSLIADCVFKAGWICLLHGIYRASKVFLELCVLIQQDLWNKNIDPRALAATQKNLGYLCLVDETDYEKAQIHLEAALAIEERLYEGDHPELAITLNNLGFCLAYLGQHGNAEGYLQRALAIQEKESGKDDLVLVSIMCNLVWLLQRNKRESEKAKSYCDKILILLQNLCDNENPQRDDTIPGFGVACFLDIKYQQKETEYFQKALKIVDRLYHANHPYKVTMLINLGGSLLRLGEKERANSYFEEALAICENGTDQNDTLLANSLDSLASCLTELRQYERAQAYLERALSFHEKRDNENDPELARTLSNLGNCFFQQRQYEKAKAYYERALCIFESKDDQHLDDTISCLHSIGLCHIQQGQYEKAKTYLERALSFHQKRDNENDPELAKTLSNLGKCFFEQRQHEKAKAYWEKALRIFESKDDQHLDDAIICLNNIGACHIRQRQYEKAKTYLERALSFHEKRDNEKDPELARTLHYIGKCLHQQKDYVKSTAYMERALAIYEKGEDENDPELAGVLNDLGLCLIYQRQYDRAKACWERALSIEEKVNHPEIATTLDNLGVCLTSLKEYDKAKAYLERALAIRENGEDGNDPELPKTLYRLGWCLKEQGQYEEAILYLVRAVSIFKMYGDNKNDGELAKTLGVLDFCLEKRGQNPYESCIIVHYVIAAILGVFLQNVFP